MEMIELQDYSFCLISTWWYSLSPLWNLIEDICNHWIIGNELDSNISSIWATFPIKMRFFNSFRRPYERRADFLVKAHRVIYLVLRHHSDRIRAVKLIPILHLRLRGLVRRRGWPLRCWWHGYLLLVCSALYRDHSCANRDEPAIM